MRNICVLKPPKSDNNLRYYIQQIRLLEEMARSFQGGSRHLLLVGNQGVGKNKVVDRLLHLMEGAREYVQLHRDSTVQSITVQVIGGLLTLRGVNRGQGHLILRKL